MDRNLTASGIDARLKSFLKGANERRRKFNEEFVAPLIVQTAKRLFTDALLDEGPAINCAWYLWDTEERIQAELERKRNVILGLPRKGQSHAGVA